MGTNGHAIVQSSTCNTNLWQHRPLRGWLDINQSLDEVMGQRGPWDPSMRNSSSHHYVSSCHMACCAPQLPATASPTTGMQLQASPPPHHQLVHTHTCQPAYPRHAAACSACAHAVHSCMPCMLSPCTRDTAARPASAHTQQQLRPGSESEGRQPRSSSPPCLQGTEPPA